MEKKKYTKRGKKLVGEQITRTKDELKQGIEGIIGKGEFEAFKKFAFKGHMIQMAIAFMLGAAFKKVTTSISEHLVMPVINYLITKTATDWREFTYSPIEGIVFELGKFIGTFIDFFLLAIILYILYRKMMAPLFAEKKEEKKEEIECIYTKECPKCYEDMFYKCTRCPSCTSWIKF